MPLSYKSMTALLAFTGCMGLVITGELNPAFMVPGLALLPGYYRFLRGREPASRRAVGALALAAAGLVVFDTMLVSGDFFLAVAHMTLVFQALKSFDLREPWDHLQVYFMSLLQLVMASELAISMAVGGMFAAFLFMMVVAMVLSHFLKEGTIGKVGLKKPVAAITLAAFAATALFFVAAPRAKGAFWQRKSTKGLKSVGFSEKVDFGSFGEVLRDSSVVMRVSVSGPRLPLYWRGITLDHFDGAAWKDTLQRRRPISARGGRFDVGHAGEVEATVQKVFLEPVDTDVVFGLGEMAAIESAGRFLTADSAGSVYLPAKIDRRFSYTAYSVPDGRARDRAIYRDYYLQLPEEMENGLERIAGLARSAAGSAGDAHGQALAVEEFLKANYSYSLDTAPPLEGMTPIEDFLFNSKKGYCEHFATSMVLMLRSLGIPARVVTGFAGGEENALGDYIIVRQSDAHSWVEAGVDGRWVRFDPTPLAPEGEASALALMFDSIKMGWYRYVVGFDFTDQRALVRGLKAPVFTMPSFAGVKLSVRPVHLVLLAAVLLPVAVGFLLRGLPKRPSDETRAYLRFRRVVRRKGGDIKPSSTPEEVTREARRLGMDAETAARFTRLYQEARFGGKTLDGEGRKSLRWLLKTARFE